MKKLKLYGYGFLALLLLSTSSQAFEKSSAIPLALVYRGAGSCKENCSEAAAAVANEAGFSVRYVSPQESDAAVFDGASLWIQPGGASSEVAKTMVPELKDHIREFVGRGNGYVGFCAGGFFATDWIADRKIHGLGILPGTNHLFSELDGGMILPITWEGTQRFVYYEGGPFFIAPQVADPSYEVVAKYADGKLASVRASYGAGRVFVTGFHPEAPEDWRTSQNLIDPDGDDSDLAREMVIWAANLNAYLP